MADYETEAAEAMGASRSHATEALAALGDASECLAGNDTNAAMLRVARAETELERACDVLRDVRWKIKQTERKGTRT